jgi:hypothetical protein
MEQLNLLEGHFDNIPTDLPLDPERYLSDRAACLHRSLHPQSAYTYGCRCVGCLKYRSAWRARMKTGPSICKVDGCDAPKRRVQGAAYCEAHTLSIKYVRTANKQPVMPSACQVCGAMSRMTKANRYGICRACSESSAALIRSAWGHHASVEMVCKWIADKACELCGRELYLGKGTGGSQGFNIDHDHSCCNRGARSCGKCIRGMLCTSCNTGLGQVERVVKLVGWKATYDYVTQRRSVMNEAA